MDQKWVGVFLSSLYTASVLAVGKQNPVPPPPAVVEQQLDDAEEQFRQAQKMFNPWYTGPLLAPSAHILPPGLVNVQPYLFITDNHGRYDEKGHSHSIPHLKTLNPSLFALFGILDWMDAIVVAQGIRNEQSGHSSMNWGDTAAILGFGLLKEGAYNPAILLSVKQSFPTGKYQHLSSNKGGVDATGAGSYQSSLGLNLSKVVWWSALHPMNFRLALNWSLPTRVHVKGFNAYGGGFGTDGKVRLGNAFSLDWGTELSLTQKWVLALDVVYSYEQETKFSGRSGVDGMGATSPVGGPFNDQLTLAPALEYNVNENLGFIGGAWLSIWGRNSFNFASGVLSFTYTF